VRWWKHKGIHNRVARGESSEFGSPSPRPRTHGQRTLNPPNFQDRTGQLASFTADSSQAVLRNSLAFKMFDMRWPWPRTRVTQPQAVVRRRALDREWMLPGRGSGRRTEVPPGSPVTARPSGPSPTAVPRSLGRRIHHPSVHRSVRSIRARNPRNRSARRVRNRCSPPMAAPKRFECRRVGPRLRCRACCVQGIRARWRAENRHSPRQ
jgi:hypothetical protein